MTVTVAVPAAYGAPAGNSERTDGATTQNEHTMNIHCKARQHRGREHEATNQHRKVTQDFVPTKWNCRPDRDATPPLRANSNATEPADSTAGDWHDTCVPLRTVEDTATDVPNRQEASAPTAEAVRVTRVPPVTGPTIGVKSDTVSYAMHVSVSKTEDKQIHTDEHI